MRARIMLFFLVPLLVGASGCTQDTGKEGAIELNDGGRLVLRADGTMSHYSASGSPLVMVEGEVMIAKDGTQVMMKSNALWRDAVEQAAVNYALGSALPWQKSAANDEWIELADGGRIKRQNDGTMVHLNAAGDGIRMAEGEVMIAKNGTAILMNKGTLWIPAPNRRVPGSGP